MRQRRQLPLITNAAQLDSDADGVDLRQPPRGGQRESGGPPTATAQEMPAIVDIGPERQEAEGGAVVDRRPGDREPIGSRCQTRTRIDHAWRLVLEGGESVRGCVADNLPTPSFDDLAVPAPGQGFFTQFRPRTSTVPGRCTTSSEQQRVNANAGACGGAVVSDGHASGQSTTFGTVAGTLANTQSSNNAYESITEVLSSGGNPANRFSQLEQRWTISVGAGTVKQLHVEGFKSSSTDGDDFRFEYSTDGTNFAPVTLTLPVADDGTDRIATLPGSLSGTVTVRVVDTDRTPTSDADTVTIDEIWIGRYRDGQLVGTRTS
jgi:hypothetical protein